MAKRFIDTDVWNDVVFDNFNKNERYFWLFLLTTRYGNIIGCFEISQNQIAYETKLSISEIQKLLYDFEHKYKLIYYSQETNEIFILNWYKYNWSKSPKLETHLLKTTSDVKNEIFKEIIENMIIELRENDTVSIPYRYHSNTNTITNNVLNNSLKEDNSKDLYNIYSEKPKNNDIDTLFNDFWKAYPKKVGKSACLNWFKRKKPNQELVDKMIYKIKEYEKTQQWQNKQYIPNPQTWLNQGRWEDEIVIEKKNETSEEFEKLKFRTIGEK